MNLRLTCERAKNYQLGLFKKLFKITIFEINKKFCAKNFQFIFVISDFTFKILTCRSA